MLHGIVVGETFQLQPGERLQGWVMAKALPGERHVHEAHALRADCPMHVAIDFYGKHQILIEHRLAP
eukprot:14576269-Alexandrium_andersonii.AAC.1